MALAETPAAEAQTAETRAAVNRFNDAFNRHDVDAVMACMTDDCVFEGTAPPDGERHIGQAAVRRVWEGLFAGSSNASFEAEEIFAIGNRCIVRWRYAWTDAEGLPGHVRGVDLFRVQDGKIAEKLAYVKG
ncbi:MAG: nuclear transport factor 2 family protein [Chloroflexi bacterium]|nr:nuclear transport factor 2 family protein [Chloroflexota bacterium]